MLEAMRRSECDQPGLVTDVRNCLLHEIDVPPGQAAAVIDYLLDVVEQLRDSNHGLRSALSSTQQADAMLAVREKDTRE